MTGPISHDSAAAIRVKQSAPLSFGSAVLRVLSGSGLGQLIVLLSTPIITRLFPPEAFGVAALFAAFASVVGVIACMRYEIAIVFPESDADAEKLVQLSVLVSLGIFGLCVMFVGADHLSDGALLIGLDGHAYLLPIAVLLSSWLNIGNYWCVRKAHFSQLSIARVTAQGTSALVTIGAGALGWATSGSLIWAGIAGQGVNTAVLATAGLLGRPAPGDRAHSNMTLRDLLKSYSRFPIYNGWSAMINNVAWMLPVLLMGLFFSPKEAGLYALGFRLLQAPMNLIGSAVGQVFLHGAGDASRSGLLGRRVEVVLGILVTATALPGILLLMMGQEIFTYIFGDQWSEAGLYTQLLSVMAVMWFIVSPLSGVLLVLGEQKVDLTLQVVGLLVRLGALIVGGVYGDPRVAVGLLGLAGAAFYAGYLYNVLRACGASLRRALKPTSRVLISALIGAIVVYGSNRLGGPTITVLATITAFAFYAFEAKTLLQGAGVFDKS